MALSKPDGTLGEPCRVLVVDDNPDIADLVATALARRDDIEVTVETDPESGLGRIEREPFDCLITDYQMPAMDGLTLCRRVRSIADIPCIVFTSMADRKLAERVRAEGFEYVCKNGGVKTYESLADQVKRHVAGAETGPGRPER